MLSVGFGLSFFSHVCVIVYSEMSVDSDRDSVIESEDGKETVVRVLSFHFPQWSSFLNLHIAEKNHIVFI